MQGGWAAPVVEKGGCAPPIAQAVCVGPDSRICARRLHLHAGHHVKVHDRCLRKSLSPQYSRKNSIRIFGIEEQTNEKLTETICKFSKQKLNIDLQPHFIDRCHRVGNYRNRNAILVKFVSCKHNKALSRQEVP